MVNFLTHRFFPALLWSVSITLAGFAAPAAGAEGKFFLLKADKPVTASQTTRVSRGAAQPRNAYARSAAAESPKNPYNVPEAKPMTVAAAATAERFFSLDKAHRSSKLGRVMSSTAKRNTDGRFMTGAKAKETEVAGVSDADVRVVSRSRRAPVAAVEVNELDDDLESASGAEHEEADALTPLVVEPAGRVKHMWPVDLAADQRISSGFGWRKHPVTGKRSFHTGVDIAAAVGTRVLASAEGTVSETGKHQNLGNYIRISHADGTMSVYGHLAKIATREGAKVKTGQIIGAIGSTGRSTGPHLHYTLKQDGSLIDPMKRLKKHEPAKVFAAKMP